MIKGTWIYILTVTGVCAGATAMLGAQKGGKPKPPSDLPGTAVISCPAPGTCGIEGDESGSNPGRLTSAGEMNITLDGSSTITLLFHGQTGSTADGSDCFGDDTKCLLEWDFQERIFSTGFQMQSNTLDASGSAELAGGLLGITVGETHLARLNMTIDMPETPDIFWRFNFNDNTTGNGGGDVIPVTRLGACTWLFSADTEQAALSTLVKPPKGKQYVHREGRYTMPFALTFDVPNCGAV